MNREINLFLSLYISSTSPSIISIEDQSNTVQTDNDSTRYSFLRNVNILQAMAKSYSILHNTFTNLEL